MAEIRPNGTETVMLSIDLKDRVEFKVNDQRVLAHLGHASLRYLPGDEGSGCGAERASMLILATCLSVQVCLLLLLLRAASLSL